MIGKKHQEQISASAQLKFKENYSYLLAVKHKQKDKAVVTPTTATTSKNVTPASDDEKQKAPIQILPTSPTMLSGCNK